MGDRSIPSQLGLLEYALFGTPLTTSLDILWLDDSNLWGTIPTELANVQLSSLALQGKYVIYWTYDCSYLGGPVPDLNISSTCSMGGPFDGDGNWCALEVIF